MNKLKLFFVFAGVASIVLIFLFIFDSRESENIYIGNPVKIGLVGPWTGSSAENGLSMKKGVELAVQNINDTGGINGRELVLFEYDDQGSPEECLKAVKQLAIVHGVAAIIGPFNSSCALAIVNLANNLEVPVITPVAMVDDINLKDDYIFRNTLGLTEAANKINAFSDFKNGKYVMLDGFGAKTVGILWQNDIWGFQMQSTVIKDMEKINRLDALIFSDSFELGQTDFTSLFKEHRGNFPDIIYVVALNKEAIQIVRQGRESGFQGLFYGEGGFNGDTFDKELGELAQGCLFSTQWHPSFSTPMSDLFVKLYTDKYDAVPDMFGAISYEATYILKTSLDKTEVFYERDDYNQYLRESLANTRSYSGVTGDIGFNHLGQSDRPVFIMQKRWSGNGLESVIIYPTKYAQSDLILNFDFDKMFNDKF